MCSCVLAPVFMERSFHLYCPTRHHRGSNVLPFHEVPTAWRVGKISVCLESLKKQQTLKTCFDTQVPEEAQMVSFSVIYSLRISVMCLLLVLTVKRCQVFYNVAMTDNCF